MFKIDISNSIISFQSNFYSLFLLIIYMRKSYDIFI